MTDSGILGVFASHAFIQGLNERLRMRLIAGVRPFTAAPGEYLSREGERAHAFYLIKSGRVEIGTRLGQSGSAPVQTVEAGDVVGWSWALPPYRWQFDARAADTVQGLVFDANWLRDQCEQDHELGYQMMRQLLAVVSSRLASTRVQKLDIYK